MVTEKYYSYIQNHCDICDFKMYLAQGEKLCFSFVGDGFCQVQL